MVLLSHGFLNEFRPLYLESKFEPLYYEYTQPKQTAGLIKKWAAGLKLGLVPHVTKENFHTLQRPIVMAYYNVDFKRDPKAGFQIKICCSQSEASIWKFLKRERNIGEIDFSRSPVSWMRPMESLHLNISLRLGHEKNLKIQFSKSSGEMILGVKKDQKLLFGMKIGTLIEWKLVKIANQHVI